MPSELQYQKWIIQKGENFINRMRWSCFMFLNPQFRIQKETYGTKTTMSAPQSKELKQFEDDFFRLIKNVQFRPIRNDFQSKLKQDIKSIHTTQDIIVSSDKTGNKYQIPVNEYNKLLNESITGTYKKTDHTDITDINKEAAKIAQKLNVDDIVDQFLQSDAYITLKDHKSNFPSKIQTRLINPSKSNLGTVSKILLQDVVSKIRKKQKSFQWTNSNDVITWFSNLRNKEKLSFFKFDITSFYPSITQELFTKVIDWAKNYHTFSVNELEVLQHVRQSYIFHKGNPWIKKNGYFDVTMGAFDGAELCELVGLFILSKLETVIEPQHLGIYRDDGLAVVNLPGPDIERLRKKFFQIFKTMNFAITIEANITATDFLDIWLDLKNSLYKPYRKQNDNPNYIHVNSNHPNSIKSDLPKMINKRLSNLSSSKQAFGDISPFYQSALDKAGYKHKLEFIAEKPSSKKKRNRHKNTIWFNPPFSASVKTNIGSKFLALIDKHFKNTNLSKLFNRSTIKVSYSCLPNMDSIITGHNSKLLKSQMVQANQKECNCRNGEVNCPLQGKCLTKSLVYKATVKCQDEEHSYIGLASNTFKERYNNHIASFKNENHKENTTLSKYIWQLKNNRKSFEVKWSIVARAPSYTPQSKRCQLCLTEKAKILFSADPNSLNKRNEIMNSCRHRKKFLLSNQT